MAALSRSQNWFVVDAPISEADQDAFGHDDVAENLHRMVTEATTHRRMIGLLGQFGVGKSTVIELLRGKLSGRADLTLIRMSAERHEPVGFHRAAVYAFAEALVDAGEVPKKDADEVLETLRSAQSTSVSDMTLSPVGRLVETAQSKLKLGARRFWLIMAGAVITAALVLGLSAALIPADVWKWLGGILIPLVTAGAFFAPFIWLASTVNLGAVNVGGLFTPGSRSSQRAKVEAADEQERAFADLVDKASNRLVVAVDDIDRLSRDQILSALNAIRSFQLTCKKSRQPIFIVAIDEQIVRAAIETGEAKTTTNAQEYLNRLFTLRQEVPVHETFDLRDYARSALTEKAAPLAAKIGDKLDDVLVMLIHDDVNDPRHVVRLINAFSSDYRLAAAREARTGSRSLISGLVTGHLDVLARVVVLKTDFPLFFRATLDDVRLVHIASQASAVDVDEDDHRYLSMAGFNPADADHTSLFRFLARTAGWVPDDIDLNPFLHLGQDRFSLTLGNAQARDIRSALANNQSAALARLGDEAQADSAEATATFIELTTSVLRQLGQAEQSNGVAAILAAVPSCAPLQSAEIARTVTTLLEKHPSWLSDVKGALKLIEAASADTASALTHTLLEIDPADSGVPVWENRAMLEPIVGEQHFAAWVERGVQAMPSWGKWREWSLDDLAERSAVLLLARAVFLAARSEEGDPAEKADFIRAQKMSGRIVGEAPVPDEEALSLAVAQPADTYECAIGLLAANRLALTGKQLSNLSFHRVESSVAAVEDDSEPLPEVKAGIADLATRTASLAAEWGGPVAGKRVPSAAVAAGIVARWIAASSFPASRGLPVLRTMAERGVTQQSALSSALFSAWADAPDEQDDDGVLLAATIDELIELAPKLEGEAQDALVGAWVPMLSDDSKLPGATRLIPTMLAAGLPPTWGDQALGALLMWFDTSYDFTGTYTQAAARVLASGQVTVSAEGMLLERLQTIFNSGGTYRARSLKAMAAMPWSGTAIVTVSKFVAPYISSLSTAEFWALIDLQLLHSRLRAEFVAHVDNLVEEGEDLPEVRARVEALVSQLSLDHAVSVVLATTSSEAMRAAAERWADISESASADDGARYLLQATGATPNARQAFAAAMAAANAELYADVVQVVLDDTMDIGGGAHADAWAFITEPLAPPVRVKLRDAIRPLLVQSQRDAVAAAAALRATTTDPEFDALIATGVQEAMDHWIVAHPDAAVTRALAAGVHGSQKSSAQALATWKRKPRIPERAEAYSAAAKLLRT
ncbi:P-loop NTPase fold protein [Microbacterium sp. Leaf151]|uniref:P-loop NTPase fold protein n=1 Tax=Microbacterium sp. Leaf151 TaxID=1736276 RepID=UPI0007021BDF|nr:P-loop NTPase fold protein [Microbacterium sp. Leaf151]KQR26151.1 hypothetical protein ASF76_02505 [Microbacterium sp. Leaf151]